VFINFEDPRVAEFLNYRLLDAVVARTTERLGDLNGCVFFLDEIQEVEGFFWNSSFRAPSDNSRREQPPQRLASRARIVCGKIFARQVAQQKALGILG
jgi:hypothetical protein